MLVLFFTPKHPQAKQFSIPPLSIVTMDPSAAWGGAARALQSELYTNFMVSLWFWCVCVGRMERWSSRILLSGQNKRPAIMKNEEGGTLASLSRKIPLNTPPPSSKIGGLPLFEVGNNGPSGL